MKGTPERQAAIYHTFNVEDLIGAGHPLRPIKRMVDRALSDMSRTFTAAYSDRGRPGVPPETLLKALLLQCLYTIRSERELCRRLKTDLLFRWFLDLQPFDEVFDHSVFSHNRDRLAEHGITQEFFDHVVKQAIEAGLTSDEHFTVDGSLIQSHASHSAARSSIGGTSPVHSNRHEGTTGVLVECPTGCGSAHPVHQQAATRSTGFSKQHPVARLTRQGPFGATRRPRGKR